MIIDRSQGYQQRNSPTSSNKIRSLTQTNFSTVRQKKTSQKTKHSAFDLDTYFNNSHINEIQS